MILWAAVVAGVELWGVMEACQGVVSVWACAGLADLQRQWWQSGSLMRLGGACSDVLQACPLDEYAENTN